MPKIYNFPTQLGAEANLFMALSALAELVLTVSGRWNQSVTIWRQQIHDQSSYWG